MKICIYGAGAIGGYMGAQLARAGADVSFVARGPHLAAMQANGVRLQIDGEEHTVKVRCTNNPEELGPQDYVVIALKAYREGRRQGTFAALMTEVAKPLSDADIANLAVYIESLEPAR